MLQVGKDPNLINGNDKRSAYQKRVLIDMAKVTERQAYKKLNLCAGTIKEISITYKIRDGILLFDKKNNKHRYIVEGDQ